MRKPVAQLLQMLAEVSLSSPQGFRQMTQPGVDSLESSVSCEDGAKSSEKIFMLYVKQVYFPTQLPYICLHITECIMVQGFVYSLS